MDILHKKLKSCLFIFFFITFNGANGTWAQSEPLKLVIDENTVIDAQSSPRLINKAIGFASDVIRDMQEEISFSLGPVGVDNSRKVRPLGNGDFIVIEQTELDFSQAQSIASKTLENLGLNFQIRGEAKPSVRRFFVSTAANEDRSDYVQLQGPANIPVVYGVQDGLYNIGYGIQVDAERYARYNDWLGRFTNNIKNFPINSAKVDQMTVGEGFALAFEGALVMGPSAKVSFHSEGFPVTTYFNYSKVVRSGRFEIIIVKSTPDRILFSIRQARQVLNKDDFRISYGLRVGAEVENISASSIEALLATAEKIPFYDKWMPSQVRLLSISRNIEAKTERRFNAVYELDMSNAANRKIYDQSLSKFDFSFLDIFTLSDVAQSSKILNAFRGSDLKLVLQQRQNAEVHTDTREFNLFGIFKRTFGLRDEFVTGQSKQGDQTYKTIEGSTGYRKEHRSFLFGDETEAFKIFSYEEYGSSKDKSSRKDDVIIYLQKTLYDNSTKVYGSNDKERNYDTRSTELVDYIREFNYFAPVGQKIQFNKEKAVEYRGLGTTEGAVDFFITREQIAAFQRLDLQKVKQMLVQAFGRHLSERKAEELLRQEPYQWKFSLFNRALFNGQALEVLEDFAEGFVDLQTALGYDDKFGVGRALRKMTANPRYTQSYARFFRWLVLSSGEQPLINISLRNTKLNINYNVNSFDGEAFLRDGLLLSQNLEQAFIGRLSLYRASDYVDSTAVNMGSGAVELRLAPDFSGFVKVIVKARQKDSNFYYDLGEYIFDLRSYVGTSYIIDWGRGQTQVERSLRYLIQNTRAQVQLFYSVSYDGRLYEGEQMFRH